MRNAFIVSAALLLVGTVGGGYTAYHLGTSHEEKAAGGADETKSPVAVMNNDAASAGVSPAAGQAPATGNAAPASTEGKSVSDASSAAAAPPAANSAPAAGKSGTTPAGTPAGNKNDSLSAGSKPTSGASQSPNAAGNTPGNNQPAGEASAAEGAFVNAKDRASGTSSTTAAPGAPTKPTSADNPSGSAPAPGTTSAATPNPATPANTPAASTAPAAATSGDAEAGKLIFAGAKKPEVNCAVCHGAQGKGGVGANLTTPDGPKGWDETQFLTALRQGQTPQKMLNATMPRFTETQLSDTEINDIHAFIKTLP